MLTFTSRAKNASLDFSFLVNIAIFTHFTILFTFSRRNEITGYERKAVLFFRFTYFVRYYSASFGLLYKYPPR